MHFSTACGCAGDSGFLESRFLYPKHGVQCLQFFLYSSGGANDSLKMWVREYDELNPQGRMTLFETITGVFKSTLSSLLKSTLRWASFRWDVKPRSWLPVAHWCPGPISNLGSCVIMAPKPSVCYLWIEQRNLFDYCACWPCPFISQIRQRFKRIMGAASRDFKHHQKVQSGVRGGEGKRLCHVGGSLARWR